jgi:hypothetical protein
MWLTGGKAFIGILTAHASWNTARARHSRSCDLVAGDWSRISRNLAETTNLPQELYILLVNEGLVSS